MVSITPISTLAVLLSICSPTVAFTQPIEGVAMAPVRRVTHHGVGNVHMPTLNKEDSPLSKRAAPGYMDALSNQRYYYLTEVEIGTPPQKLDLLLDTGSSDTWVFLSSTQVRGSQGKTTTFDQSKSSTFRSNGTTWQIKYGKGQASGAWGTDKFRIGGATLKSLSIGLAQNVNQISTGLVGIGRPEAEITVNSGGGVYDNLPLRMKSEGLINSAAYSLSLSNLNDAQGNIIFGGVDHDQYSGVLAVLPITHAKHMGVQLQGVTASGRATYPLLAKPATAILDSGTSLSYFDGNTLGAIRVALNTNPSFAIGERYYTDCNITEAITLDFGTVQIPVPAYNFLWPIDMFVDGITASLDFPQNSCYVGLEQSGQDENFILLGDNMLRAMYIVYDVTDHRIAIAKSKPSSGKPQIEAIHPGKPIPGSFM